MDFPDTRWTLIAHLGDEEKAGTALDQLCAAYWQPIHAYLIQAGNSHAQSQDLTQCFLETVVRRRLLERANPVSGKLRSWLVAALQHFLANVRRYDSRQKRGGGNQSLPLDHIETVAEWQWLAAPNLSPDEAFDRTWIAVLLRRVLDQIARQYHSAGKSEEYAALLPSMLEGGDFSQMEAATRAGMTVAKFRVQLHRLRGRYRELLRQEIVATLEHEADYDEELAYFFRIMGRPV